MTYRDPTLALTARRDSLRARLREFPDDADAQVSLAEVLADIEGEARRDAKPRLAASQCPASFEGMTGDEVVRRCALCGDRVYELRGLTTQEAQARLDEIGDRPTKLWRRPDGTLRVGDCAVGRSQSQRRALYGLLAVAAVFALGLVFSISPPPPTRFVERPVPSCPAPEPERPRGAFDAETFLHGPQPRPYSELDEEERRRADEELRRSMSYFASQPLIGALTGPEGAFGSELESPTPTTRGTKSR